MWSGERRRRARNRYCVYCDQKRRGIRQFHNDTIDDFKYIKQGEKSQYICMKCRKGAENFKEDEIVWRIWDEEDD